MSDPTRQTDAFDSADATPAEAEIDRRLVAEFRSAGFPPAPKGVELEVRRRIAAGSRLLSPIAIAAAVLIGAVGVGLWLVAWNIPTPPDAPEIADKTTPKIEDRNGGSPARPVELRELAALRSAPPVDGMSIVRREQDALLSVLDEMIKEN